MTNPSTLAPLSAYFRIKRAGFDIDVKSSNRGMRIFLLQDGIRVTHLDASRSNAATNVQVLEICRAGRFNRGGSIERAMDALAVVAEAIQ